eukprot:UN06053
MKSSGTQIFTLNAGHIAFFAVNQRIANFSSMKQNFHFYFPTHFS